MDASAVPRLDPVVRVQTIKATIASSNAATAEANATPKRRRVVRSGPCAVSGDSAAPRESRNADSKSPTLVLYRPDLPGGRRVVVEETDYMVAFARIIDDFARAVLSRPSFGNFFSA